MNDIRLSICIPTYNFGAFIGQTLDSIIQQAVAGIEIVVVDGHSTDNTAEVVQQYKQIYPELNYYLLEEKGGIDKDLATTIGLARGEYCWLMSSDDVLKVGAIQRVLNEIRSGCEVYLCNRTLCDRSLHPIKDTTWLAPSIQDRTFSFSTASDYVRYYNDARSLGALFSYISVIIVNRASWSKATCDDRALHSNYAHVATLFSLLHHGGRLKYIHSSLVFCRGDNDSFAEKGAVQRHLIDLDSYFLIANILFQDPAVRQAFLSVMQREHKWYIFIELRSLISDRNRWDAFEKKLVAFGYSPKYLRIIRILGALKFPLRMARCLWELMKQVGILKARLLLEIRKRWTSDGRP